MGAAGTRTIQVFIASPSDVQTERERVERVVVRLNREFAGSAQFQVFRWEHHFYSAHAQPQELIPRPAECDIVIVLFGHRLGSPMPDSFGQRMEDGSAYPSGTAFELLSAIEASRAGRGHPAVYVFRTTAKRSFQEGAEAEWAAARTDTARLDAFFARWFEAPGQPTERLYHRFRDPDDLAAQVDETLRQWAGLSLRTAPQWLPERDKSPFRGLEQFDARHSRVFFGRDRKVERATLALTAARERGLAFLLVVGPSGSGKSSLVRAGLVPRLTGGSLVADVDLWRVAVMKPGGSASPFLALAQALFAPGATEPGSDADPGGFGPALPELANGPFREAGALAELMRHAPASAPAPIVSTLDEAGRADKARGAFGREVRVDLLLLVDQLEEIFAGTVSDEERNGFASLLTQLVRSRRVCVVATLRADLYPRMIDHRSPFLALKDGGGFYDLASPGTAELAEILQKSAAAAGLSYGTDPETGETLDELLLRDAEGADTLPLLQFCLQQLYLKRSVVGDTVELTVAAYRELGGLDGAISLEAERTIAGSGRPAAEVDRVLGHLLRHMAVRVVTDLSAITAGPSLTVRAIPLALAAPDVAARAVVDDLVRARLLIVRGETKHEPFIRFAHERVLTSWERARRVVEAYNDYFRVRGDLEQRHRLWKSGRWGSDLLLAGGTGLQEAQAVVRQFGSDIPADIVEFVRRSARRARLERGFKLAAVAMVALFAVVSGAFGLLATNAEQRSARNYEAAKGAADTLVARVALDLRSQSTVSNSVIDTAFGAAEALIDRILAAVAAKGSLSPHDIGESIARMRAGNKEQLAALDRSRGALLYEFAETYHQTKNSPAKAHAMAEQSLATRQALRAGGDGSADMLAGIAESEMLLADLDRSALENAPGTNNARPPDYAPVRQRLRSALALLEQLPAERLDEPRLVQDASRVLTRLGDVELRERNAKAALEDYRRARDYAMRMVRQAPSSAEAVTELAWAYRKFGQSSLADKQPDVASKAFDDEVCIRRRVMLLLPGRWRAEQDLGWALQWAGAARLPERAAADPAARSDVLEALTRRMALVRDNPTQKGLYEDIGRSLKQAADLSGARGETAAANLFQQAGAALQDGIGQAFPDREAAAQTAPGLSKVDQAQWQERGPEAMFGAGRTYVERVVNDFAHDEVGRIDEAASGCWNSLLETATASK